MGERIWWLGGLVLLVVVGIGWLNLRNPDPLQTHSDELSRRGDPGGAAL